MPVRQILSALFAAVLLTSAAAAQDFERNLPASSSTDLYVSTGSGKIHVSPGSDSEVHVKAHLHAGWNAGGDIEERMRRIAANPPITTSGKEIHIGEVPADQRDLYKNIAIEYEITAPRAAPWATGLSPLFESCVLGAEAVVVALGSKPVCVLASE